jgi:transporter family-2 protein
VQPVLIAFVAAAGLLAATQAGTNAALGRAIGPELAGIFSVLGTAICLLSLGLVLGGLTWPGAGRAASAPWWAWTARW